jgi:hypothetical protein
MKKVVIELSAEEVQRLLAIALDEDRDEALEFVRHHLARRVEKLLRGG